MAVLLPSPTDRRPHPAGAGAVLAELPALPRPPAGPDVSVRAAHVVAIVIWMFAAVLAVWFDDLVTRW